MKLSYRLDGGREGTVKIIRIERDYSMTLKQQEKKIRQEYENVTYFSSDGRGTITIFAEGRREK